MRDLKGDIDPARAMAVIIGGVLAAAGITAAILFFVQEVARQA